MSGSIPSGLNLDKMFYFDLSFNELSGTLPSDLGEDFDVLRHLYLDHNQFGGTIPESYATVGNSRIINLHLNDNLLTGSVPAGWSEDNKQVLTIRVQNNQFTESLDERICRLDLFALAGGELLDLRADCDICDCDGPCDACY